MKTHVAGSMGTIGGILLVVLLGAAVGFVFLKNNRGSKVLTHNLSEPLGEATSAKVEISAGTGNLEVDQLTGSGDVLASGALQYLENQDEPSRSLNVSGGQATLSLSAAGGRPSGFHFPWEACNGETNWQIHLNPSVPYDLTIYSGGGNLNLNFGEMTLSRLAAETGGGNIDLVLPANTANLNVTAKSGAGNVTVRLPGNTAARIHMTTGLGKVIVDAGFTKIDDKTYQSANYDSATEKVEITLSSGAGNVEVKTF